MVDSPKSKKTSKIKGNRESGLPPKNEVCSTSFRVRQFTNSWMTKSSKSMTDDDDIWKLKPEDIHIDRLLGQGSFSTARLVYIRNPTTGHFESEDETFVMKRLKASVLEDELSFQMASSDIGIETRILASLRHVNILRLRGVKAGNMMDALRDGSFFLVVDWLVETLDVRLARWGTRKSLFRTQESSTVLRRLQDIALGIAEGMEYLHSKHILFR
jgi:serine/threonine protein kinase